MKKLSEIKGDEALDVLADLIEPITNICVDEDVKNAFKSGEKLAKAISVIVKNHKREVTTILAVLEGEDPDKYEPTVFELPVKLMQLLSDETVMSVFRLQGLTGGAKSSTSASESTEG